jgi:succinoglycan biosynthesis protein ExoA
MTQGPLQAGTTDRPAPSPAAPVSVVMPVLNEERYLAESVRRVLDQSYDGILEVILAVGPSRDRTAQIAAELAAADSRIRVVDNPSGRTPHAMNAAIAASRHPYIVRVDAHGFLPPGYLRDVVRLLDTTGAANVGGRMQVEGDNAFGEAVARAMSSPLGIGGAKFHVGGEPGPADTVYLGAFRREVLERVGGFDEHFHRAQDWELNYRLRQAGETVWFDPALAVTYRPRRSLRDLARQFHGSGRWRRQIVGRYPDTASFRYLAPPVVTACVGVGAVTGAAGALTGARLLLLGWAAPGGYAAGLLVACGVMGRGLPMRARLWLPVVTATMHLSWGAGFLRNVRD